MSSAPAGRAAEHPAPVQADVMAAGRELAACLPGPARTPGAAADEAMMAAVAADERLRTALFRFVDVRPACRTRRDVGDHLVALLDESAPASRAGRAATALAGRRRTRGLAAVVAGLGVQRMAHRFIIGESVPGAARSLDRLWRAGIASSVDLLGEATVSEQEAESYAARCSRSLGDLSRLAAGWPPRPTLEPDSLGPVPRTNLSVKITALTPEIRPEAPLRGMQGAVQRLRLLLRQAREAGAHLHIDMESLDSRETVLGLALELLAEPEFRDGPSAGVVLQAYLRDSAEELDTILRWTASSGRTVPLTVRLVKGAYWDHEVVEARQHGWSVPVFETRADCDRNFEELTRRLLAAHPHLRLAVASHNLRSIAHALACLPLYGVDRGDVEFQVLRGLGDDVSRALADLGLRARAYCPVGDLVEGMAYLVRRMLENTANDSFLQARARGAPLEELLGAP
jgi:RHH-type proline utilization regulon transcriptional repressor/proline dehydrogenase/delta 1-pyrroline-5-carboxylate dehydrogenase